LGPYVSEVILSVDLMRISGSIILLHIPVQDAGCWVGNVAFVQPSITHMTQNTRPCKEVMENFVDWTNCWLSFHWYRRDCVVNIDETKIYSGMENGLIKAIKVNNNVSFKTTRTSMRCIVLHGVTLLKEKMPYLVDFEGKSPGKMVKILSFKKVHG
jgi:hypothetical protein